MTDQHTPLSPLSPRHERFVLEYLKDANATQAYVRAGYSPRGAQPSASKLLRRPDIEAAIAAGRQRLVETLEVSVERLAREYAKIAFANVADYVSTDEQGGLRVDLDKASDAQRAGILELKLSNHRNPEQRQVTLKLGKLQALAALTKHVGLFAKKAAPGLTAEDRERYEARHAADRRDVESANERYWSIQKRLGEVETKLAKAEYAALAAKRAAGIAIPSVYDDEAPRAAPRETQDHSKPCEAAAPEAPRPPVALTRPTLAQPQPHPQPTLAPPEVAGAGRGVIFYNTSRQPPSGPTWHDIIRDSHFTGQWARVVPRAAKDRAE
jgi:phage terminase small subunit